MLVELSKSQDIEAGDGTTSVCVIAGALLSACGDLLAKGIHPMAVAESFLAASEKAEEILEGMSTPVDLANRLVGRIPFVSTVVNLAFPRKSMIHARPIWRTALCPRIAGLRISFLHSYIFTQTRFFLRLIYFT